MGLQSFVQKFKTEPSYPIFEDLGLTHSVRPQQQTSPFPHIIIDNFLPAAQAISLKEHLEHTLSLGLSTEPSRDKFSHRDVYDVDLFWPAPALDAPWSPFFSQSYFSMLRTLFNKPLSTD